MAFQITTYIDAVTELRRFKMTNDKPPQDPFRPLYPAIGTVNIYIHQNLPEFMQRYPNKTRSDLEAL